MAAIAVILFILGLAAGSFVNALVWRLHEQKLIANSPEPIVKKRTPKKLSATSYQLSAKNRELSILHGRSMCPHCRHQLSWYDLVPVVSWLALGGRCRYCHKPISPQYLIVELLTGIVFAGSYIFWPATVHQGGQWLLLAVWLACSVALMALAVYDLRWLVLPSTIIYPALLVAAAGRAAYIAAYEPQKGRGLLLWLLSLIVASGVFCLIYQAGERFKRELIGYGDVRLGLLTGTLLAAPAKSFLMIFLASIIGTLAVLPDLTRGKKTMASRLPFGPFLIIATALVVAFGGHILDWYRRATGI